MEKNNAPYYKVIKILLIPMALLCLVWGYYQLTKSSRDIDRPKKTTLSEEQIKTRNNDKDLENLNRADVKDADLYAAMIRLSQQGVVEARTVAMKNIHSSSSMLRQGAIYALGYFDDDESFSKLKLFTKDPDISTRISALYSLGNRHSQERVSFLKSYLFKKPQDDDEALTAYYSLGRISTDEKQKQQVLMQLIHLAKSSHLNSKNPLKTSQEAIEKAIALAPTHPDLMDSLKKILLTDRYPHLVQPMLFHLTVMNDPWLKKHLSPLIRKSKDKTTVLIATQVIHLVCPKDRWSLLEMLLKRKGEPELHQHILKEIRWMPGLPALRFVRQMLASSLQDDGLITELKKLETQLMQPSQQADSCGYLESPAPETLPGSRPKASSVKK